VSAFWSTITPAFAQAVHNNFKKGSVAYEKELFSVVDFFRVFALLLDVVAGAG
jgi:hypothetical protein